MASHLTRRQLLGAGVVAGAATLLGPLGTAVARAAGSASTPRHLRRATYTALTGERLRVGAVVLRLDAVDDLAGAAASERLRGHEEAFALTLTGPADGAPAGIRTVAHPALGTCELFVAPVGEASGRGVQRYEVVVDRSVGAPQDPPAPTPGHEPPPARPGSPQAAAAAVATARAEQRKAAVRVRKRAKRRAQRLAARRARRRAAARRKARLTAARRRRSARRLPRRTRRR